MFKNVSDAIAHGLKFGRASLRDAEFATQLRGGAYPAVMIDGADHYAGRVGKNWLIAAVATDIGYRMATKRAAVAEVQKRARQMAIARVDAIQDRAAARAHAAEQRAAANVAKAAKAAADAAAPQQLSLF